MQCKNSSLSIKMVLQPDFCPPPKPRGSQPHYNQPTPPHQMTNQRTSNYGCRMSAPSVNSSSIQVYSPIPDRGGARHPPHHRSAWDDDAKPMHFDVTINPPGRNERSSLKFDQGHRHMPHKSGAYMPMNSSLTVYPRVERGNVGNIPRYDPLFDPHLRDFFDKKFQQRPRSAQQQQTWSSTGYRGSSLGRFTSPHVVITRDSYAYRLKSPTKKRHPYGDVTYKVTVRTGDIKGAGTDAWVYIRLVGKRGKVPKWRLFKKSGQSNCKTFRFANGSSHIFEHKGGDIGELQKVIIEHDGISESDGWYLHEIVVEDTKYDCSYTFPCEQWLSLYKGDCQTTRHLSAVDGKQTKRITYEVTTVTGEKRGAGTDANVFVTFFGFEGKSPKLRLVSQKRRSFQGGQSDVFKVRTVNVGKMKKIRIEIDNQGFAPAWFLDRVIVSDLSKSGNQVYFPCGQWLSEDEQLYRDLIGSKDPHAKQKMNTYVVHTFTGDVKGAGTDADVYITLFGSSGDSGQVLLDNDENNFKRKKKDSFNIECPHLGKLQKIRIVHNNDGLSPGWFLSKVLIDDLMKRAVYIFPCERWFAKDEDDGRISRELIAGKGDAGIPYTVSVYTGDVHGAGTDAEVYIILYGGRKGHQSSGKVILDGKFSRNRVDICNIECASMLGPLERIEVGHDNRGADPGWFLDKIVITCNTNGCEQTFLCRKWFTTNEGDKLICRELNESKSLRRQVQQKNAWNCIIYTSNVRNAGTDANVFVQIYGEQGKSDVTLLYNESDYFEAGQKALYKIDIPELGEIYKLRVWHDDAKPFSGWHLNKIQLEPVITSKKQSSVNTYNFNCQKWLDSSKGELIRELPATGAGIERPQPVVRYHVTVTTGMQSGAGTYSNVFCCLFGSQGDTGDRPLLKSKNNQNKFQRKSVDEFVIEAVTLKKVNKVKIGHDDSGKASGWFLDKVEVREENGNRTKTFPCSRWLATDEDDGAIVRELLEEGNPQLLNSPTSSKQIYHVSNADGTSGKTSPCSSASSGRSVPMESLSQINYEIIVVTADEKGAGTDADVCVTIYGTNGDSGSRPLKKKGFFERNQTDKFNLELFDLGDLIKIRLEHDDSGDNSDWLCDHVIIRNTASDKSFKFLCREWIGNKKANQLYRDVMLTSVG